MPAHSPYIPTDNNGTEFLKVEVEGDLEKGRSVYFTDQSPKFTVTVTNIGDKPITGSTYVRIVFDESSRSYERDAESIDCELEPGETNVVEYELDMLSYQGNTAVVIDRVGATLSGGEWDLHRYGSDRHRRVYTFMVYDRDYYKLNYFRPRYAQYIAAALSVGIVSLGVIQVLLSL